MALSSAAAAPTRQAARRGRLSLPVKLVAGGLLIVLLVGIALAAPWIAPYRFDEMSILHRLKPPSARNWFGTDDFGRD
ncbi:MAG: ABC transporter permease, partial [Janthinobacterium lividum]